MGLRIRSGLALCVVLEGSRGAWRVVGSRAVKLSPEGSKFSRFPFHPLIELEGRAAQAESRKAVAAVRATAAREIAALLSDLSPLDAAGIVGGSLRDPQLIHNPHMQAHAREAQLFRDVAAAGLSRAGVGFEVLSDRDVLARLAGRHESSVAAIDASLREAGRGRFRPWAAHQKLAAAGALWSLR